MSNYPPPQQQAGYPTYPGYPGNNYPAPGQYPPLQQAYYQPQQPQAYGLQQQGAVQMNYGQQLAYQQQVVTTQPLQMVQFQQVPVRCQCPHCHNIVTSKVSREIGNTTFIYCLIMSLVCCCCCPFCMDCAKNASHSCPNCKKHLATFKQPVVQSGGGGGSSKHNYDPTFGGPGDDGTGRGPVDHGGGGGDDGGDGGD